MSHPLNPSLHPEDDNLPVPRKPPIRYNPLLSTDSYKPSHYLQYPADTQSMIAYLEARGGEFEDSTLFGLQAFMHQYLSQPITAQDVTEAAAFFAAHGEPFNEAGFMLIVRKYSGHWPVTIRAIPEGTVVPVKNALLTIECTDPACFWVVSYLETQLARLWYGCTIAIQSREFAKVQKTFLDLSSDTPDQDRPFKVHDFGGRGVTCREQAQIGGAAHLLSFMGSDTVEGTQYANHYYDCEMASFSIPAAEHSTVTSWGRENEFDFYRHFVKTFLTDRQLPPGVPKLAACVSDTYNIFDAVKFWCSSEMRVTLKASGGTLVIRPDSGEPIETLTKVFEILEKELSWNGSLGEITVNSKGYKVLPPYLRVIQGDGIDLKSMEAILERIVTDLGWSATNIAFGSGGGLLQKVNRDTQKFAFKCCAVKRNGTIVEIYKDPITDPGKKSKCGRLDLVKWPDSGEYETIKLPDTLLSHPYSVLKTVFHNGQILQHATFEQIRARMAL